MGEKVLLVTPLVRLEHDLVRRLLEVIGDLEDAAAIVEQQLLALINFHFLNQDHHSILATAGGRTVHELSH